MPPTQVTPTPAIVNPAPAQNPTPQVTDPNANPNPAANPAENNKDAERFKQLAYREKLIRNRARQIEERERKLQEREAAMQSQPQSDWKQRLLQNPMSVLQEAGMTTEQLTGLLMNPQNMTEQQILALNQKLDKFISQTAEQQKKDQDAAYQSALNQVRSDVQRMVKSDDQFETIRTLGQEETVVELIRQTFEEEGYMMSEEEAAKAVEEELLERLANAKKIKEKFTVKTDDPNANPNPAPAPGATTITHSMNQAPPKKAMTWQERRQRAIDAAMGKLNPA